MFTARTRKVGLVAALFLSGTLLSACGSSDQDASRDGNGTGRANVDAVTRDNANDSMNANAGPGTGSAREVISERMPYAEVGEELVYGYFVAPSDMFEPLPAVIMIHEWKGLNDNVRSMADRLAAEGYIVLAVDLYGGKTAKTSAEARELMLSVTEDPEAANDNIRSAFEFVSTTAGAPKVASVGWRFGGTWALQAAMLLPDELDATVIYYAHVSADEDELRPVDSPILGLFAGEDISIKAASVEAFGTALERLRKDHEIHVYAGVSQTFADPTSDHYDKAAATDAWGRMLDFLGRHLSVDES